MAPTGGFLDSMLQLSWCAAHCAFVMAESTYQLHARPYMLPQAPARKQLCSLSGASQGQGVCTPLQGPITKRKAADANDAVARKRAHAEAAN